MVTIEQQNVYGGQGIVQFTLYPNDVVPPFTQVQLCVIQSRGSIGRHCTPKLNRLFIGILGEGILRVDDIDILFSANVVQSVSHTQTIEVLNKSTDTEISFWIIQARVNT